MNLRDYLKDNRLIPDGSMGTYYTGMVNQSGAVSEYANLTSPEIIGQIHRQYIEAGAGMLRTNTFAANRAVLKLEVKEQKRLIEAACRIAKEAAADALSAHKRKHPIWILGDIGPIPESADTEEEAILEEYKLMCDIFIEQGLDGIHFETFSSTGYMEQLVPYIKKKKQDMFILTSFSINKNGYTAAGISVERLFDKVGRMEGIDACGLNCGVGSGHMYQSLKKAAFPENRFLYAAPNAGYPEQLQNRMVFLENTRYFTENMKLIAGLGVDIIGGCCGTTPEYIRNLTENIDSSNRYAVKKTAPLSSQGSTRPVAENDLYKLMQSGKKVIAVELDPPYDANIDQMMECAHKLKTSGADIITFADSPMGRSRVDSILMSIKIAEETNLKVMPHICCRDRNMISMRSVLLGAYIHGIRNLLLVTGDPVPGDNRTNATGVFDYNSLRLMEYVREMNTEHFPGEPFCYGGALNHRRGSLEKVVERMRQKIAAGASYFLTQPIYCAEDADRIRQIKEKLDTRILCGIMPLVSYRNACFIRNEFSGIHVPEEIVNSYHPDMSREEAENVGAAIAREMLELLEPVADGYYFMLPFNRVSLLDKILRDSQR